MICNGEHPSPACLDPQCWHRAPDLQTELEDTIAWSRVKAYLEDTLSQRLNEDPYSRRNDAYNLLQFIQKHWSGPVPLQQQTAEQVQQIRKLTKKNREYRAYIKLIHQKIREIVINAHISEYCPSCSVLAGHDHKDNCILREIDDDQVLSEES